MVTKLAIVGANGKVATRLVTRLAHLKDEFDTTAFIRNAEQAPKFAQLGLKYSTAIDITNSKVADITEALKGFDAVVFSAGAAGKGLDLTFSVDLDGAVKVSEAVKAANVKRFVLVSALKSLDREFWWGTALRSYYIAKKYADEIIIKSDINWTILQPGLLKDEDATGKISDPSTVNELVTDIKESKVPAEIPRDDVALAIIESLRNENTIKKVIPLISGDIPTKEALNLI